MIQRVTLLIISIFFLLTNLYAQEEEAKSEYGLRQGSWSLQFRVSQNLTLASFENSLFSLKNHNADNRAWRFSIGVGSNISSTDRETNHFSSDIRTNQMIRDLDVKNFSLEVTAQALRYVSTKNEINAFWGIGPTFGIAYSKSTFDEVTNPELNGSETTNENTTNDYVIGIEGLFGVEWFLNSNISLISEYSAIISFGYRQATGETTNPNSESKTEETIKEIRLNSRGVRFGLSVYF